MADPTGLSDILQSLMGNLGPPPAGEIAAAGTPQLNPLGASWGDVKKGLRAMGVKPTADANLKRLWLAAQKMGLSNGPGSKDPSALEAALRGLMTRSTPPVLPQSGTMSAAGFTGPGRLVSGLLRQPGEAAAASAPTAVEQLAAVPRQVVATPVMPKMGFWDRLMGTTQTIEPGKTAGAVGSGTRAAGRTLDVAAEMSSRGNLDANIATLGFDPRAVSTAAKAAAQAKVPLTGAAGGAAKTAAAAAAELGWKEAYQKGTGALLKKIATVATTKRPTAAGSFGKGLGSLFLIMLAQQLWSSLLQHGVLMPGGKGLEDLQKEAVGQQAQAALGMAKAQMPSESALLAQAMLGPMQQQAGQAQQAALQSGAQMSDMGWM